MNDYLICSIQTITHQLVAVKEFFLDRGHNNFHEDLWKSYSGKQLWVIGFLKNDFFSSTYYNVYQAYSLRSLWLEHLQEPSSPSKIQHLECTNHAKMSLLSHKTLSVLLIINMYFFFLQEEIKMISWKHERSDTQYITYVICNYSGYTS